MIFLNKIVLYIKDFFLNFWKKHSELLFASLILSVILLFYMMNLFSSLDDYLFSLIYQMNYSSKAAPQRILLVKKDEATSSLIAKNPSRQEFASIINTLGKTQTIKYPEGRSLSCKLMDLRIGMYSAGKKNLIIVPWVGKVSSPPTDDVTFWRFSENVSRLFEFMEFPLDVLASQPANIFSLPPDDLSEQFRSAFFRFYENIRYSRWKVAFEVFPKPDTLFQWQICVDVDLPESYQIQPASVIVMDFVLEGEKKKSEDELLEKVISESEAPVVLGMQVKAEEQASQNLIEVKKSDTQKAEEKTVSTEKVWEILPDKKFIKQNTELGAINVSVGDRNFVWQVPLFHYIPKQDKLVPAISLLAATLALDKDSVDPGKQLYYRSMRDELERILPLYKEKKYFGGFHLYDRIIPTDEQGNMGVYFFGSGQVNRFGKKTMFSASFYECFDAQTLASHAARLPENAGLLAPENAHRNVLSELRNFGGKICILGPYEKTDFDFYPSPVTKETPIKLQDEPLAGMEIHANAMLSIIENRYMRHSRLLHTFFLLIATTLLLTKILEHVTPFKGLFITAFFIFGIFYFAYYIFNRNGQIFVFSPMVFSFSAVWITHTFRSYLQQRKKAGEIKNMFQKFVAADVVKYMIEHPEEVKPGGRKVELTIFFSDVAGFTSISEMLTPEELVVLLNEYLGTMTDLLFKYGGTLDKFIGDAVMAFWNNPLKQEDHAIRACLCALEMQETILELQKGWAERKLPKVMARAGINTANVVVGYMGSQSAQMNFTCMGDGVNLASRLEGANKEYGTLMMISDATYQKAKDHVTVRFLDFLAVKGKKEPVKVFELVSRKGKEPLEWDEKVALYDKAIALHLERKWDEAIDTFETLLARWPDDGPSKTYLSRCHEYKETPPPDNWDGSYHLTHK
ncbi:MAG: CHASE2 domain-containing protein [Candidatus Riflebacteria bacterium]|nr:CHASE2 domain-containing protein [Candidatus Riflebacteria bacterium]